MCKHALTTLNMTEYVSINWKNKSVEYARILNVSDAVQSIRPGVASPRPPGYTSVSVVEYASINKHL